MTEEVVVHLPRRWWGRRLASRLGRRGCILTALGFTWLLIGYGVIIRPPAVMPGAFHLLAPTWLRGTGWLITGLVALIYAWHPAPAKLPRRRGEFAPQRWRDLHDTDAFGWAALYIMPAIRVLSYGGAFSAWVCDQILTWLSNLAWLDRLAVWWGDPAGFHAQNVLTGTWDAWYPMATHIPMLVIVLVCSGWKEPAHGENL